VSVPHAVASSSLLVLAEDPHCAKGYPARKQQGDGDRPSYSRGFRSES
jgi:hypothetical protein